jgi:hypothetical protein
MKRKQAGGRLPATAALHLGSLPQGRLTACELRIKPTPHTTAWAGEMLGRPWFTGNIANGRASLRPRVKDDGPRRVLCTPLGSFTRCGSVESVKAEADDDMNV